MDERIELTEMSTETQIKTVGGRRVLCRREKILMPNGKYRYPIRYIDLTSEMVHIPREQLIKNRIPGY